MNENFNSSVRCVWISKNPAVYRDLASAGLDVCLRGSLKARFMTLRAGVVVFSSGLQAVPFGYTAGATTIQHGHGIPLKGPRQRSEPKSKFWPVTRRFEKIAEQLERKVYSVDYICTSSERCTDQFKMYEEISNNNGFLERAVRFGEPLNTGFPKTDILYREIEGSDIGNTPADEAAANQLKSDHTTIGYFPTFREYDSEIAPFDPDRLDAFLKAHNVQLAIKPHRHMSVDYGTIDTDNVVKIPPGMDSYPILDDIDILITDYSSIYFDFLHLDRPVVFYTFDLDNFARHRGVMPNYEELCAGPRVMDFDSLVETLETILETDNYARERARIRDDLYDHQDGQACRRLCSLLLTSNEI